MQAPGEQPRPGGSAPVDPPGKDMHTAFVRGSLWSFAERWGGKVTTLLTFIVLGHLLQPDEFGLVALALVLITIVHIFTDLGASAYLVQQQTLTRRTQDTAFWATIFLGLALYALLWLISPVLEQALDSRGLAQVLRVFGLVLIISPFAAIQTALLTREMNFRSLTARTLVSTAVGAVVALGLAFSDQGVWALVGQQLTANLVSVAVLWRASTWRPGLDVRADEMRHIFGYGAAIAGTTLLDQVGTLAPSFLTGSLLGPRTLGYFSVGSRLPLTFVELFANVLASVSLPIFARLKTDRGRLSAAYHRSVVTGSALTTLMLMLLAALSPLLLPLLFGGGWEPAVPVAQLGALAAVFSTARCFDRNLRLALGAQRLDLVLSSIGCTTMVVVLLTVGRHGLVPLLLGQLVVEAMRWGLSLLACARLVDASGLALTVLVARNFALGAAAAGAAHVAMGVDTDPWVGVFLASSAGLAVWIVLVTVAAPSIRNEVFGVLRSVRRDVRP